jgi:hypothetical protein
MAEMRAKLQVSSVFKSESGNETVRFHGVAKSNGYPPDGMDEDNTFAKWSPSAHFEICIANPALWGKFEAGQKFYVDFEKAPD